MTLRHYGFAIVLAGAALGLVGPPLAGQANQACAGQPSCAEVTTFIATVSDFRESTTGTYRLVSATIRFQNKADGPLVLGYVSGSGLAVDDRGNRYQVQGGPGVRGIGEVNANTFDPKFVLQSGEVSDARFEFVWQPRRGDIYGTTYEIDLAIREIDPVTASQYRLGKEHVLHFSGFGEGAVAAAAVPAAPSGGEPPAAEAAMPVKDPCGGDARCNHAGPFVAEVVRVNLSKRDPYNDQIVETTVRFSNVSNEPLIIGYQSGSSVMVDDVGNRYLWGRPGTHDTSVKGIGSVTGRSADPSFMLKPGQSRDATFTVWFRAGRKQVGTRYAFDFTVEQLEILPSQQVRSVREYAVGFRDLNTGSWGSGGGGLLGDVLKALQGKK